MKNSTIFKGCVMIGGLAAVRLLDQWLPDYIPVGLPEWVVITVVSLKYASGLWASHSVLRRFLHQVSGGKE